MTTKTQLRGHCQCCGRVQAVTRGHVAQHGYEVKDGYFQGVCHGHNYGPIEFDRGTADSICASVRAEAVVLSQRAADIKAGRALPVMAKAGYDFKTRQYAMVAFALASEHEQRNAIAAEVSRCEGRAKAGEQFADRLESLCIEFHGKPLAEVVKPEAPAPIVYGERRTFPNGRIGVVTRVDGARVHWTDDKGFRGRTNSRAWRALAA